MARDTRRRMIEAAAELIRTRGLHDTSFTDILDASGAARGAIYHHFPDGKQQLAREAVLLTQQRVLEQLRAADHSSPEAFLTDFLAMLRSIAESTGGPGCAVGAVLQDSAEPETALVEAADGTFTVWTDQIAYELETAGLHPAHARPFATLMIATLEGTHLLCKAAHSTAPLDRVGESLHQALAAMTAVAASSPGPPSAGSLEMRDLGERRRGVGRRPRRAR
jgi:AcrR family transcriptional regulator